MTSFLTTQNDFCIPTPPATTSTSNLSPDLVISGESGLDWQGFGLSFNELGWRALGHASEQDRNKVLDDFFHPDGDLKFTFCRLPIGANDYSFDWYSHDEVAGDFDLTHFSIDRDHRALIPYIREGLRRQPDLKLFASPWSPPTWFKNPPVMNNGRLIMEPAHLKTYADYFVKFVQAYAEEGIRIDQIHVQNEPVSSQKFPSCVISGEEFRVFIGQYLGPAFEAAGLDTDIWLGTLNGPPTDHRRFTTDFNHYALPVLTDPDAARHVKGISYQWDGKHALAQTRQAFPTLPLLQSENECGDGNNTWQHAWYVCDLVYEYLNQGMLAYVYWNGVLEPGGESTWGWKQNSLVTIDEQGQVFRTPEYRIFQHFAKSLPAGSRPLRREGPWSTNAIAHRVDDTLHVVLRNPLPREVTLTVRIGNKNWAISLPPESLVTTTLPMQ